MGLCFTGIYTVDIHAQGYTIVDSCWCEGAPTNIFTDDFENQPYPGPGGFIEVFLSNAKDLVDWIVIKGSVSIHDKAHGNLGTGNPRTGRIHIDLNGSSIGGIKRKIEGLEPFVPTIISFQYARHRGIEEAISNLQIENGEWLDQTWRATNDGRGEWLYKRFTFIPTSSEAEIKFESLIQHRCCGMLIDNIIVQQCKRITIDTTICAGESFRGFTETGIYEDDYPLQTDCDSTVFINLTVNPKQEIFIDQTICTDDTLTYGGRDFYTSGDYTIALKNQFDCDSIIRLQLNVVDCSINSSSTNSDVRCYGNNNAMIEFAITGNGTAPYAYSVKNLIGEIIDSGQINNDLEVIRLQNLKATTYLIEVTDILGAKTIVKRIVEQPEPINVQFIFSDYNGYQVSCPDASDGRVEAIPSGGTAPFDLLWDNGKSNAVLNNLNPASLRLTVTDNNNCIFNVQADLHAPPPLDLVLESKNPSCFEEQSGSIKVLAQKGGIAPYTLFFGNQAFLSDTSFFIDLDAGTYSLILQDANACEIRQEVQLRKSIVPILDIPDTIRIDLGTQATIAVNNKTQTASSTWREDPGLNCYDCLSPSLIATKSGFYRIEVQSMDQCSIQDSVFIHVNPSRDVYIPNAFTPNGDGLNDRFEIFRGVGAKEILSMQIFDKWGNIVFDNRPNNGRSKSAFWDGILNGNHLSAGVYIYNIQILFLDDVVKQYNGEVMLLR